MYSTLNRLPEDQREAGPALFTKANLMGNQGACFTKLTGPFWTTISTDPETVLEMQRLSWIWKMFLA